MAAADALYLSVPEAARRVDLSESTVWAAIKGGDLAATRPTVNGRPLRSVRIAVAELDAWLQAGESA